MRLLGLDIGDQRIGVALSDPLGFTAQPLAVLQRKNLAADLAVLQALVKQHDVKAVVVGLPLTLRGEQGIQAQKAKSFSDALRRRLNVPVIPVDERLTTVQGQRALRESGASVRTRKQVIDQVAAQLILQHYLEMQRAHAAQ